MKRLKDSVMESTSDPNIQNTCTHTHTRTYILGGEIVARYCTNVLQRLTTKLIKAVIDTENDAKRRSLREGKSIKNCKIVYVKKIETESETLLMSHLEGYCHSCVDPQISQPTCERML